VEDFAALPSPVSTGSGSKGLSQSAPHEQS
jgi:hypothetical protein